ncbi:MAG TPA: hypothetical protein DCE80_10210 [Ignavibacteriales bacterium]|nr:hypothetical protein [Ignavibacteriales bacterium]
MNTTQKPQLHKHSVSNCASSIKEGSFADGIRLINTRGSFVKPTRLTKQRAIILLDFIDEYKRSWYCSHPEGEGFEDMENEMQLACQWLMSQISKRWSQNELYEPRKKRS